jgi:PDZ domain/Caspase domain
LKVDTLLNSIGSPTKIVFLDACRDNPVLYRNIVKGRGSSPIGLAPASASNFSQAKPGGGVFIAYATDAGTVADDGTEAHSPFTQALLRYMQQIISIDDMFSLVTREVRLVTKNAQRPYKYASLENIICLTPSCTSAPVAATADVVEQVKQSANDELQIAAQTNNADALESYLDKYPDTSKRAEISNQIASIKRAEFTEWTLFEVANQHLPWFIQLSSIRQFGNRVAVKLRYLLDPSAPKVFNGKSLPDAVYGESLSVYDCTNLIMADAENSFFNGSGDLLFHYKWAEPQYLNLAIGAKIVPGSVGATAKNLVCHERIRTPIVTKKQLAAMKFASLSSTAAGDGEIFYALSRSEKDVQDQKEVVVLIKNNTDRNVVFPQGTSIPDPPSFRTEVDRILLRCDKNEFAITKIEFWNASNQLVRVAALDPGADVPFSQSVPFSPNATMQAIACPNGYAGLGVQIALDKDAVKVTTVYDDSPAARAGIRAGDVITQISNEPIGGLALTQVTEKLRGTPNSEVILTITREGSSSSLQLKVSRDIIHVKSPQETLR